MKESLLIIHFSNGDFKRCAFLTIEKKKPKGQWPVFKENYYNAKGSDFDAILKLIEQEKLGNFLNYIR